MIHSEATDHLCNLLDNFLSHKDVYSLNHYISIPNGVRVKVNKIGTIKLLNNLFLENIIFVPNFKFNSVSVQKLCMNKNYFVSFTNDVSWFQAPLMKGPILLGQRFQGLYYVQAPINNSNQIHFAVSVGHKTSIVYENLLNFRMLG